MSSHESAQRKTKHQEHKEHKEQMRVFPQGGGGGGGSKRVAPEVFTGPERKAEIEQEQKTQLSKPKRF